ncbi:MAG TPA: hypothetical protein PLF13_03490 [candidate division Zixibacteria bacterium]|nr:hypothetical protein [candidate division Zixibacteria bacterium]
MIKRDPIFYSALGIFALGLIAAAFQQNWAIVLLVGAYLLRPALNVLNLAGKYEDERQNQIHSRSGNIGFLVLIIGIVALIVVRTSRGEPGDELYGLLFVGLAARALSGLLMVGEPRTAGTVILISIGLLYLLFNAAEGLTLESLMNSTPGWAILILGLLSRKFPRPIALIVIALSLFLFYFFGLYKSEQIVVTLLLFVPLVVSAGCLWYRRRLDPEPAG